MMPKVAHDRTGTGAHYPPGIVLRRAIEFLGWGVRRGCQLHFTCERNSQRVLGLSGLRRPDPAVSPQLMEVAAFLTSMFPELVEIVIQSPGIR